MKRVITYLASNVALTKTFLSDGSSKPYPMVNMFSSGNIEIESIEDFFTLAKDIGDNGGALLKGHLLKELRGESRKGQHNTNEPTTWMAVDYDSNEGFESFHDMLKSIDPVLADTDYIFQHSASAGVRHKPGLRAHAFFLLKKPVSPAVLKQWFIKLNLSVKGLRDNIRLSKNAMALCYPLDVTINQNDKLIYVATPQFIGIDDPLPERFTLVKGSRREYEIKDQVSLAVNKTRAVELINELQDAAGITRQKPKYATLGDEDILLNPVVCDVTGTKREDEYTRVNLNGGDSWAYWHWARDPEILYNFKGEPPCYLKDIAPQYYSQLVSQTSEDSIRPFVFHERRTDLFFSAIYDESSERLLSCHRVSARKTMQEFMQQRGRPMPRFVPDWEVEFDPTRLEQVDFDKKWINQFQPSPLLYNVLKTEAVPNVNPDNFPTIEKVLRHICVDDETYNHFIRWLAHIVQFRSKTQTAWVFQGVEGTGKGTLYHQILVPIFSAVHCHYIGKDQIEEKYNEYLRTNLITFFDEAEVSSSKQAENVMAKLRQTITEPTLPIRMMRVDMMNFPNFTNVIIASNKTTPVLLNSGDRRYNVAPRQDDKIQFNESEYKNFVAELKPFLFHLKQINLESAEEMVGNVLNNDAKLELLKLCATVSEEFFHALRDGNLEFFTDQLLISPKFPDDGYAAFSNVITKWVETAGSELEVPIDDLLTVYQYIGGNNITAKRFGHAAGRNNLKGERGRVNGLLKTVYRVTFKNGDYNEWLEKRKAPVVSIKSTK